MNTLETITKKFNLQITDSTRMPLEIVNFGRNHLAALFHELGFERGVEVGVRDGEYSEVLCMKNPDAVIYGIDPYVPHRGYLDTTRQSSFDKYEAKAHERLDQYKNYHFMKAFSLDAVEDFEDESLDFVYIDADHDFQNVTNDVHEWMKKLRIGGILAGHDYVKHKGPSRIHVYQALNGYMDAWQLRPWFVLGAKAIEDGVIRDEARSWMYVKQK